MRWRRQCAAIPVAIDADGQLKVLLVTSRGEERWMVPKGWIAPRLTLADAAAREAFATAGVVGQIVGQTSIASYWRYKRLGAMRPVACEVSVFLLRVEWQLDAWPEQDRRNTRWFTPVEAATFVGEAELARLLLRLPSFLARCDIGLTAADSRSRPLRGRPRKSTIDALQRAA